MVWRWSLEMEEELEPTWELSAPVLDLTQLCLLYTSDAADE